MPTNIDVVSFLEEVSNKYERLLREQTVLEEFARKLKSEPSEYETVIDDQPHENMQNPQDSNIENQLQKDTKNSKDSNYILVLETTDSCYTTKEQLDICDEILNDWIVSDSLNEIDLKNVQTESPDCHVLEYTSISSPNCESVMKLEGTAEKIHVETKVNHGEIVLCWTDRNLNQHENMQEIPLEQKLEEPILLEEGPERVLEDSKPITVDDENIERKLDQSKIVSPDVIVETMKSEFTINEGSDMEQPLNESEVVVDDEESERESDDSELIIAEDEGIERESSDRELDIVEGEIEQKLEHDKLPGVNCAAVEEKPERSNDANVCHSVGKLLCVYYAFITPLRYYSVKL